MKARELIENKPDIEKTVREADDCSADARGACKIARYIHPESKAIITERDWCTKHGQEAELYELST